MIKTMEIIGTIIKLNIQIQVLKANIKYKLNNHQNYLTLYNSIFPLYFRSINVEILINHYINKKKGTD
jgi:hypothetical protein